MQKKLLNLFGEDGKSAFELDTMDGSAWEHQMSYALNCARMHFVQCRNEADLQGGEIQSFWYLMDTSISIESY